MYVFAYGSLLDARSAARTLPGLLADQCIPARVEGFTRTFDVAFPNDGSQRDKAYYREDRSRPEIVLFANLRTSARAFGANGVLVPVDDDALRRLAARERRYRLVGIDDRVTPYAPWTTRGGPVVAFLGRAEFTGRDAVTAGVVPSGYLGSILTGARNWDDRCPGFADDFAATTQMPPAERIVPLRRVDLAE